MKKPKPIYNWDELPIVLKPDIVALIFGLSESAVRRYAENGTIPAFKIGKLWRFRKEEIRAFTEGA